MTPIRIKFDELVYLDRKHLDPGYWPTETRVTTALAVAVATVSETLVKFVVLRDDGTFDLVRIDECVAVDAQER